MQLQINNNVATRTWRELVEELTDALIANPQLASQPACFSTDSAEGLAAGGEAGTIYYVRGFAEASDGDLVMTRGL